MWGGTELVHFKPTPGTLIIFPGFLEHEYAVDHGKEPFRFTLEYTSSAERNGKRCLKRKIHSYMSSYIKRSSSFYCKLFFNAKRVYDTCRERRYFSPRNYYWIL